MLGGKIKGEQQQLQVPSHDVADASPIWGEIKNRFYDTFTDFRQASLSLTKYLQVQH